VTRPILHQATTGPIEGVQYGRHRIGDADYLYALAGDGRPVPLLHGFPQTHYCWRTLISALSATHTVVSPDLRGYGESRAPVADLGVKASVSATWWRSSWTS
jgi:pimeloyl-ACP methyl ester carboxylesterase